MANKLETFLGLVEVAESINRVRIKCDSMERTAPQNGIYGQVSKALHDTLELILGANANLEVDVYIAILDGNSVADALRIVSAQNHIVLF
jgi:hypothetical protein